jgi:DNA repair protein RadA/Sms
MPALRSVFFCNECGNETPRWEGQCPHCRAWNSLVEQRAPKAGRQGAAAARTEPARVLRIGDVAGGAVPRLETGIAELDFVLGGGLVAGSLVLIGGEPGIGKSTLLLQAAAGLEAASRPTLYVSGEESAAQVRMRAARLPRTADAVSFLGETAVDAILARAADVAPAVLIVDSIQTVHAPDIEGAPGNVTQIRECAARLQRFAKESGTIVLLVGHVTREGTVAGPRTLEHIVDTVIYFEDSGSLDHRLLRVTKNRFGSVDEIGVFRMTSAGLVAVDNPSQLFLRQRTGASGATVAVVLEGSRPLLVEVQALCTRASYGAPQRVATGFDRQRLSLLLAVLEKRVGVAFGQLDVFVNVVGGIRLREPASDLAIAIALVSAALDSPVGEHVAFIGEVGLGGELRGVPRMERRLAEAERQGFGTLYVPAAAAPAAPDARITVRGLEDLVAIVAEVFPRP